MTCSRCSAERLRAHAILNDKDLAEQEIVRQRRVIQALKQREVLDAEEAVMILDSHRVEVTETGCWQWTLAPNNQGYGMFHRRCVHRIVFAAVKGEIPEGLELDHLCRNRACCNPDHLEAVTHLENVRRGKSATKTHCVNGHPLTPENTYRHPSTGRRRCLFCKRAAHARHSEREKARIKALRPKVLNCETCGSEFSVKPRGLVPRFCSRPCWPASRAAA